MFLLAPHANYVAPVKKILDAGIPVKGMAHITGGGLVENVPRVLPEGLGRVIDRATWTPQPIFSLMQRLGNIDDHEMHRTFNMGVGLVLIGPPGLQDELAAAIGFPQFKVWELGRVEGKRIRRAFRRGQLNGTTDTARCNSTLPDLHGSAARREVSGQGARHVRDRRRAFAMLVTTDRQSGFDRLLGAIPLQGTGVESHVLILV
jgi:hypothetical protein